MHFSGLTNGFHSSYTLENKAISEEIEIFGVSRTGIFIKFVVDELCLMGTDLKTNLFNLDEVFSVSLIYRLLKFFKNLC